jgi:hypothetical protein
MAELKTKVNDASITEFLESIEDESKRKDTYTILEMMKKTSKAEPKMWGSSIIGFGFYHYYYASGREGDWFLIGVSPRKQNITLYVLGGWEHKTGLLAKLGKHSLGKGCMYIKRLSDVNLPILEQLIDESYSYASKLAQEYAKKQADQKK